MSWQRIDQNTYIDNTLVTCAEYQLFIDEMRNKGKYYQPDHWVSFQFPQGSAQKPVLGVRLTDAIAFCEWVQKTNRGWKFRLPTREEAEEYLIENSELQGLGYWKERFIVNLASYFAWIGNIPGDPRGITRHLHVLNHLGVASEDYDIFQRPISDPLHLDLSLYRIDALMRKELIDRRNVTGNLIRIHDIDIAMKLSRELVDALKRDLDRDLDRAFKPDLSRLKTFDLPTIKAFHDYATAMGYGSLSALDGHRDVLVFAYHFKNELNQCFELIRALDGDMHWQHHIVHDLYTDIITLQLRILGRCSAFEGIRLVKERK